MSKPLITLTLIAKNEKHNVRRCLDSVWPWVDEVVVVDTGSTDGTIGEFRRYATEHGEPDKLITGTYTWTDDFAEARQVADDLATGEWVTWCDLDDTITGMAELRGMVENATQEVVAFFARYQYARDKDGNTISELWRERVVRNDGTKWTGRLHEHKLITNGHAVQVDPQIAEWVHWRDHEQRTGERNLRVLEAWDKDQPDDPRIVQSIAMEYMGMERHQQAADMFERYLKFPGEEPDRRAQAARHMCVQLMMLQRPLDARAAALTALQENWLWPDTHLTLAEAAHTTGHPREGVSHAKTAMEIGKPATLLIINPHQYTAQPLAIMAACLGQMGKLDDGLQAVDECLAIAPSYPLAHQIRPWLVNLLRKERAVQSTLASAEVLIESGKPQKARALLDQAPWYVDDEPRLVQRRAQLSALIRERLAKPVELLPDEAADALVAQFQVAA